MLAGTGETADNTAHVTDSVIFSLGGRGLGNLMR